MKAASRVAQIAALVIAFASGEWWVPLLVVTLVVAIETGDDGTSPK